MDKKKSVVYLWNPLQTVHLFDTSMQAQNMWLQYAWTPHLSKDIDHWSLGSCGLKMCLKNWKANYPDLLDQHQPPVSMHEGST